MRTILEEVLMEEYPGNEAHECNCGCIKCNQDSELEALFEDAETQVKISTIPTPGAYYQIKRGDNLLSVVGKAYNVREGAERLKLAQMVNDYYINIKFWRPVINAFEKNNFPSGIISFNPKFDCGETKLMTDRRKCYAKIWIPLNKESIIVNPNLDQAKTSACAVINNTEKLIVRKIANNKNKTFSVLARGSSKIPTIQADWLIELYNESEYKKKENGYLVLFEKIKKIMPTIELSVEIIENKLWGDKIILDMEHVIKKSIETYINDIAKSKKKSTPPVIIYHFIEAQYKVQLEKRANLGRCLTQLYELAGLKKFSDLKKGKYFLIIYFPVDFENFKKIITKKNLNEILQERDGYQSVTKTIPQWFPENAKSWAKIISKEVETMRFPSKNPMLGDDVIVWKLNGIVQGYKEYPKSIEYYKKYLMKRKLYFSYANKNKVAEILFRTYSQWNSDMKYFVEEKKMSPYDARDYVRKLNDEFFKVATKDMFMAILGVASNIKISSSIFGLIESIGNWLKWGESKLKTDSITPD